MSFIKRLYQSLSPQNIRKKTFESSTIKDPTQSIRSLCYSGLRYQISEDTEGQRRKYHKKEASLPIHIQMINLAYHLGCKSILELGAGLSTGLLANYARITGARVQTIEVDFDPMWSYVRGTYLESLVANHIKLYEGATITPEELVAFYRNPRIALGNVSVIEFAHLLESFARPHPRLKKINKLDNSCEKSIEMLIVEREGRLFFPEQLLNIYSTGKRFDKEIAFLEKVGSKGSAGILQKLFKEGQTWDFVFFDSGELSSMVEWECLKDRIQIGGLVAFHDIFFPKSMKSFAICASLVKDANWKPVYMDHTTNQGGFVAQRIR